MLKNVNIALLKDLDIWKIESKWDKHLMEYFLELPIFNKLCISDKYIIIWRKWTGKTAIRRAFISKMETTSNIRDIDFQSIFSTTFFDTLIAEPNEAKKTNRDLIKFTLLIQWMMLIIKDDTINETKRDIIEAILQDNWYVDLSTIWEELLETKTITTSKEFNLAIKNFWYKSSSTSTKSDGSENVDYIKILPYLEKFVFSCIGDSTKDYYLLIDELDKLWVDYKESSDIYVRVILNLILWAAELNESLSRLKSWNSRIIIFIRNDMMKELEWATGDMWKLIQDYSLTIDWQSWYEDATWLLNSMIEKRIVAWLRLLWMNPEDYNTTILGILKWSDILSDTISKPPSYCRDISWIFDIKKFLHNRTLLRPRDYVAFFKILSESSGIETFERQYSTYYQMQTLDELKSLIDYNVLKKTIQELCRNSSARFKWSDFKDIYAIERIQKEVNFRWRDNSIDNTHPQYRKYHKEAEVLLENILYPYSVIWYIDHIRTKEWKPVFDEYWRPKEKARFFHREEDTRQFSDEECILHAWLYKAFWIV